MQGPIGSIQITGRTSKLNVYEIDAVENTVLIGINQTKPQKRELQWGLDGPYFRHGNQKYMLGNIPKIDGKGALYNGRELSI